MPDPDPAITGVCLPPAVCQSQHTFIVIGDAISATNWPSDLGAVGVTPGGNILLSRATAVIGEINCKRKFVKCVNDFLFDIVVLLHKSYYFLL